MRKYDDRKNMTTNTKHMKKAVTTICDERRKS